MRLLVRRRFKKQHGALSGITTNLRLRHRLARGIIRFSLECSLEVETDHKRTLVEHHTVPYQPCTVPTEESVLLPHGRGL